MHVAPTYFYVASPAKSLGSTIHILMNPAIEIPNPKLYADAPDAGELRLYPYYAGYASTFTESVLRAMKLPKGATVLDPWNGSGTTSSTATKLGYAAIGQDLNPVMVLVAKAALLPQSEASSLIPLAEAIIKASLTKVTQIAQDDPLLTWFAPSSVIEIRSIEVEINKSLISSSKYLPLTKASEVNSVSSIAAFFYVALFRVCRELLKSFVPSNPTWIKKPKSLAERKRPVFAKISSEFVNQVSALARRLTTQKIEGEVSIALANSESMPLDKDVIDGVLGSPPYCTRIDYAVATSIELAILRIGGAEADQLRRSLMGSSTVPKQAADLDAEWGATCLRFLERLHVHPSKASSTYYYKNHVTYFSSLANSISEINRVLKPNRSAILVVQDSYYKDIHNDVPQIVVEMGKLNGLSLQVRRDFITSRSMGGINMHSKKYRTSQEIKESVLWMVKN